MFFEDLDCFVDDLFSCKDGVIGDVKVVTDPKGVRSIIYVGENGGYSINLGSCGRKFDIGFLTEMFLLYTRLAKVVESVDSGFKQADEKKEDTPKQGCTPKEDGDIIYKIKFHGGEQHEECDGLFCGNDGNGENLCCEECLYEMYGDECDDNNYHVNIDISLDKVLVDKLIENGFFSIDRIVIFFKKK